MPAEGQRAQAAGSGAASGRRGAGARLRLCGASAHGRSIVLLREVLLPLEEEDEPVHLAKRLHRAAVEGVDLLKLDAFDAHLLDELGEDAGVGLDGAPVGHIGDGSCPGGACSATRKRRILRKEEM